MKNSSQSKTRTLILLPFFIGAGLIGIQGCQVKPKTINQPVLTSNKAIQQIEIRLEKIERELSKRSDPIPTRGIKTPAGRIKSLTFRLGTRDDRLRIYWADGSNSDLPCTKEQSIWACG